MYINLDLLYIIKFYAHLNTRFLQGKYNSNLLLVINIATKQTIYHSSKHSVSTTQLSNWIEMSKSEFLKLFKNIKGILFSR